MIQKRLLNTDEFELTPPSDSKEIVENSDSLFAELLIRYYYCLTKVNDKGKLLDIRGTQE
jgi:hypothetical protein